MEKILDFGSGNTCKNDPKKIKKMIDELAKVDKKRQCIIKWQLWHKDNPQGENIRLIGDSFYFAYEYAKTKGFRTTASVFDEKALNFLVSTFDVPFVKIANRRDLYWLANKVPKEIPVYISYDNEAYLPPLMEHDRKLFCISKYPAEYDDYITRRGSGDYRGFCGLNISDHTIGLYLINKNSHIEIWEKHYVLKHDTFNPDAGLFAITPKELKEILC